MAAVDFFLKLDGIKGESKDHKHKGEIDIESFSFGGHQHGAHSTGGGGGAGKVKIHDITITKVVDAASTHLMLHCCNGKHIASGLITCRKAGGKPLEYLKIKLTDILVSSYQSSGSSGGGIPQSESLTLNFSKFNVTHTEQDATGAPVSPPGEMGWDIKANQNL